MLSPAPYNQRYFKDVVKGLPFLPWKNYLLLCPTGGSEFPELNTDKKIYEPKTKNKHNTCINMVSSTVKNIYLISSTLAHDILHLYTFTF
jgi:hypothetical protein